MLLMKQLGISVTASALRCARLTAISFGESLKWTKPTLEERFAAWVVGDVHTNGIESVWSLLKRSIIGSYHKVSIKHLDAYLDELEHRFNNRKNEYIFRDTLTKLVMAAKLTYQELTKKAA